MEFHFAPVQGHTDAPYRHFHSKFYGNQQEYYTPFIRWENMGIRQRDLKDLNSDLNNNLILVPQIIFRNKEELKSLINKLKENGEKRIDLNLGCPFPLQTGHGRGAAAISNQELGKDIEELISENPDIQFSVKMRLGFKEPDEWKNLLPILNNISLKHIAVHPRTAKQQYEGELNLEEFKAILDESKNPVIFNGEIKTPADIAKIEHSFPGIKGIMIGRGLLGRPSIIEEYSNGKEFDKEKRIYKMIDFHNELYRYYEKVLCGDNQILMKIKPFWEYAEKEIGKKPWKNIKKATSVPKYKTALSTIIQNI